MPKNLSLIFVGGIADSGKSKLIKQVCSEVKGVQSFAVSDFLQRALSKAGKKPPEKLGPEVTLIDWKSLESAAITELSSEVLKCFDSGKVETVVINTHYATYSPGGFLIGLDPDSIKAICAACKLDSGNEGTAAVVLVDIGIADVLNRREQRWSSGDVGSSATGAMLIQDLEFNRVYSFHYYSFLTALLDKTRVRYYRLFIDYENKQLNKDLPELPEFKVALSKFKDFLKDAKLTQRQ